VPKWQVWIAVPFIVPVIYLSYMGSSYESSDRNIPHSVAYGNEGYWYSDDACELSVKFPGEPKYQINHGPGGIQIREARLDTQDGFHLKAECTDYGGIWDGVNISARDEDWIAWMQSFMAAEGFSNPQISSNRTSIQDGREIDIVDGRGYKTLDGSREASAFLDNYSQ
jgi:hypothetical protein